MEALELLKKRVTDLIHLSAAQQVALEAAHKKLAGLAQDNERLQKEQEMMAQQLMSHTIAGVIADEDQRSLAVAEIDGIVAGIDRILLQLND